MGKEDAVCVGSWDLLGDQGTCYLTCQKIATHILIVTIIVETKSRPDVTHLYAVCMPTHARHIEQSRGRGRGQYTAKQSILDHMYVVLVCEYIYQKLG